MGVHPSALQSPPAEARSVIVPDHDGEPESMNLRTRVEAQQTWCAFSRVAHGTGSGDAGTMTVSNSPAFNRVGFKERDRLSTPDATRCIADACAHWRWRQASGTRYELRSFQSEFPVPEGNVPPVEVEDGWEFTHWEPNSLKAKAPLPRYWARRAVEILLPRGLCGLAGEP